MVRRLNPMVAVRAVQVLLWVLVAAGPILAVLLLLEVGALGERIDAVGVPVEIRPDTSDAEGYAELVIGDYLAAGSDGADTGGESAAGSWSVVRTVSLGARELGPGYVAVTVAVDLLAADVLESDGGGVRRLFFSVGVAETGEGWVTVGSPSVVAPPPAAEGIAGADLGDVDDVPGLEETVERFLAAYLTGDGDLARYTAPGVVLAPVSPPPFVSVELLDAGSATTPTGLPYVAAEIRAVDAGGGELVLGYSLGVVEREGRWEVTELLPAPLLPGDVEVVREEDAGD